MAAVRHLPPSRVLFPVNNFAALSCQRTEAKAAFWPSSSVPTAFLRLKSYVRRASAELNYFRAHIA